MSSDAAAQRREMDALAAQLYHELREIARRVRGGRKALDATEVVHEAYLRLARAAAFETLDRANFLSLAATVMRRVLVDEARRQRKLKHGGGFERVTMSDSQAMIGAPDADLLDLDQALERLAVLDARQARIVELRFFGGLSAEEVAPLVGLTRRAVSDECAHARAWLARELSRGL